MILISGPTVTPARQGWWTTEYRLRERGFESSDIADAVSLLRMDDEVTRTGRGLAELKAAAERARSEPWFAAVPFRGVPAPTRAFYRRIIDFARADRGKCCDLGPIFTTERTERTEDNVQNVC